MVEETLLDNILTSSDTAGGFAEYFNDELDSTILAYYWTIDKSVQ